MYLPSAMKVALGWDVWILTILTGLWAFYLVIVDPLIEANRRWLRSGRHFVMPLLAGVVAGHIHVSIASWFTNDWMVIFGLANALFLLTTIIWLLILNIIVRGNEQFDLPPPTLTVR